MSSDPVSVVLNILLHFTSSVCLLALIIKHLALSVEGNATQLSHLFQTFACEFPHILFLRALLIESNGMATMKSSLLYF